MTTGCDILNRLVWPRLTRPAKPVSLLDLPVEIQEIIIKKILPSIKDYFTLASTCWKLRYRLLKPELWYFKQHDWFRLSGAKYYLHSRLVSIPLAYQSQVLKTYIDNWQNSKHGQSCSSCHSPQYRAPLSHLSYFEMTVMQDLDHVVEPIELGLFHGGCLNLKESSLQHNSYQWTSELAIVTFSSKGDVSLFFESLMPMSDPQVQTIPWKKGDIIGMGISMDSNMIFVTMNGHFLMQAPTHVLRGFDSVDWVAVNYRRKQWMVQLVCSIPFHYEMNFGKSPFAFDLCSMTAHKIVSRKRNPCCYPTAKGGASSLVKQNAATNALSWRPTGIDIVLSTDTRALKSLCFPRISNRSANEHVVEFQNVPSPNGAPSSPSYRSISLRLPELMDVDFLYIEVTVLNLDTHPTAQNETQEENDDDRTIVFNEPSQNGLAIGMIQGPCISPFTMVGKAPRSVGYAIESRKLMEEGSHCSVLRFGDEKELKIGTTVGLGFYPKERILFFTRQGERIGPRMIFGDYACSTPLFSRDKTLDSKSIWPCVPTISSSIGITLVVRTAVLNKANSSSTSKKDWLDSGKFLYTDDPSTEWMSLRTV